MSQEPFNRQQTQKFRDIDVRGDGNVITIEQILGQKVIYVSVDEIKTREFIQASPYKGLKKFDQEDKDRFFGRDQFIKELANELEQTNLILLLGASGSGKSSIVRAGLLSWLSKKWGSRLVCLTLTPDQDPFESLYASLLRYYKQANAQIARDGREDTLTKVVTGLRRADSFWFIFIDQFEELFTTSQADKRDRFIADLVRLTTALKLLGSIKDCPVKVVATMRADFLGSFSPYPALVEATNKHRPLIAEMRSDELRQAIEQPAAQHGVVFETGLVEEIIKDVQGQAGYLPLLQYTLNLVWETEVQNGSIHDRTLNISTYRGLGGVRGALQKHVDQIYQSLSEAQRLAAQRIFLKLVEIGGDEESGTEWKPVRRRALRSEFDSEIERRVLVQLIDENLLVSDRQPQAQESTVEIAHEALLTSWETLNTWIKENRQAIALRNRLNDDVARWQAKKAEDELWTGSKLEQVLELKKDPTFNQVLGGFSSTANQFIDSSLRLRDHIKKRQLRQARTIATASVGVVALVSVTGVVAMVQRQAAIQQRQETMKQKEQAERQAQIALAQQLISKAEIARGQGSTQLQFSMLLAIEGVQRLNELGVPSTEGDAVLRYGLDLLKLPMSRNDIERLSTSQALPNSETVGQQVKSTNCALTKIAVRECRSSGSKNIAQILGLLGASGGSNTVDFPVQIIDATTKQLLAVLPHRDHVKYAAFFGENRYAVSQVYGEDEGKVRYWDLGFDKESTHLIINSTESENLSDLFNSKLSEKIKELNLNVKADQLSFQGKYVARLQNNALELRDVATNNLIMSLDPGSAYFSLDDQYLATLSDKDKTLRILEIGSAKVIFQQSMEVLSRDVKVIGDGSKMNLLLEELRNNLTLSNGFFVDKDKNIYSHLSIVGPWGVVFLWTINKNQIEIIPGSGRIVETSLSRLGTYIATNDTYNRIQIFETSSRRRIMELQNISKGDSSYGGSSELTFSPDEKYIAIVSLGNIVRIFEVFTGKEIHRLEVGSRAILEYPGKGIRVSKLVFSPDGQNLATKFLLFNENSPEEEQPGGILLWSLQTKNLVPNVCSRLTRNLLFREWKQIFGDVPYQKTCSNLPLPQDLPKGSSDVGILDKTSATNPTPDDSQVLTSLNASPILSSNSSSTPSQQSQESTQSTSPKILQKSQPSVLPTPVESERVAFDKGGTETIIQGHITTDRIKQYLLWCKNGQHMSIQIREGDLKVTVASPDGQILGIADATKQWQGQLPSNGDYTVKIGSSTESNYTVRVEIL